MMRMKTAKLFKNGKSQVVSLPEGFQFEGSEVLIKKAGNAVVLLPKKTPWNSLLDSLSQFTDDFMAEPRYPSKSDRRGSL